MSNQQVSAHIDQDKGELYYDFTRTNANVNSQDFYVDFHLTLNENSLWLVLVPAQQTFENYNINIEELHDVDEFDISEVFDRLRTDSLIR